ncbi:MAG: HNH endonuclease [Bdellovibrionaceae bacterium]|nr:HNH endonuclease [Pseudobdellovibrionaceae bacterium]
MFTRLNEVQKTQNEKSLRAIHSRTCEVVAKLKSCEAELILCLQEVDRFLVHRFLGYNNLHQYAMRALKLSEAQSYAYITVARKARELPLLQQAITAGELTVSKAVRITSVINGENQRKWIGLALELPKRDLEREVARVNPRAARPEQARFLDAHTLELSTPLSESGYRKLERVRELMSSSQREWVSLEHAIESLAEFYLQRKDPVRRAERAERRRRRTDSISGFGHDVTVATSIANFGATETTEASQTPVLGNAATNTHDQAPGFVTPSPSDEKLARARTSEVALSFLEKQAHQGSPEFSLHTSCRPSLRTTPQSRRRPLPAASQHHVHLRDQGSCQARLPDGAVCGSRVWLEVHHLTPRSEGGTDAVDNLLTLCRAHHQAWHQAGTTSSRPHA